MGRHWNVTLFAEYFVCRTRASGISWLKKISDAVTWNIAFERCRMNFIPRNRAIFGENYFDEKRYCAQIYLREAQNYEFRKKNASAGRAEIRLVHPILCNGSGKWLSYIRARNFRRRKHGKWFNKINTMGTTLYRHLEHRGKMEDGGATDGEI